MQQYFLMPTRYNHSGHSSFSYKYSSSLVSIYNTSYYQHAIAEFKLVMSFPNANADLSLSHEHIDVSLEDVEVEGGRDHLSPAEPFLVRAAINAHSY